MQGRHRPSHLRFVEQAIAKLVNEVGHLNFIIDYRLDSYGKEPWLLIIDRMPYQSGMTLGEAVEKALKVKAETQR